MTQVEFWTKLILLKRYSLSNMWHFRFRFTYEVT
jgi:hypothetical protein